MGETYEYGVKLKDETSGPAKQAAASLEQLRARIEAGKASISGLRDEMSRLKGGSDKVKQAKDELKKRLDNEKKALTGSTEQLKQAKKAHAELAKASKPPKSEKGKGVGDALQMAGGPLGDLAGKLGTLKDLAAGAGGGMNLLAGGAAAAAIAVAALGAALVSGAVSLGKWVLETGNAARTSALWRESVTGSAANGKALAWQIDQLAGKVPMARAELQEMALGMWKAGLSGQTLVDSMAAVAQTSGAMGEDIAGNFKSILEAGKMLGNFQLPDPREMRGWGVNFEDIATSLAANLNIGIGQARTALRNGRVKIADGAKALRDAAEKKFGEINLRKSLNLTVIAGRFKEGLVKLVSGINLDPLLKGLDSMSKMLDQSSVGGYVLKQMFDLIGNAIIGKIVEGAPLAKTAILKIGIALMDLVLVALRAKVAMDDALKPIERVTGPISAFKIGVWLLGEAFLFLGNMAKIAGFSIEFAAGAIRRVVEPIGAIGTAIVSAFKSVAWPSLGGDIVAGVAAGIRAKIDMGKQAMLEFAKALKDAFGLSLLIKSPSKVFERYGAFTTQGFERGVEGGTPSAVAAIDTMAARTAAAGAPKARGSDRGSAGVITVNVTVNSSKGNPAEDPSFLANLTKAIEEALIAQGLAA